jgi:hypothetical protein
MSTMAPAPAVTAPGSSPRPCRRILALSDLHLGAGRLAWVAELAPDVLLSGHVHEAPGAPGGDWFERPGRTLALDAGQVPGNRPAHFDIDLVAGEVRWHSTVTGVAVTESVAVDAATMQPSPVPVG